MVHKVNYLQSFNLGSWRVEPTAYELIDRNGVRTKIEPKVMRLLCFLASQPGKVVTRAALFEEIWHGVLVVDGAVTRAVYELRKALAAQGDGRCYIETVRHAGYRLLETPVFESPSVSAEQDTEVHPKTPETGQARQHRKPARQRLQSRPHIWFSGLVAAVMACSIIAWTLLPEKPSTQLFAVVDLDSATALPVTSNKGRELAPRLSRDGSRFAYVVYDRSRDTTGIFEEMIHGNGNGELTRVSGRVTSLAYSPNNEKIVFASVSAQGVGRRCTISMFSRLNNQVERIFDCKTSVFAHLDWHPNSGMLAIAHQPVQSAAFRVDLFDLQRARFVNTLFEAPEQQPAVWFPRFSPDGSSLAFATGFRGLEGTVWTAPISQTAPAHEVYMPHGSVTGLDWWRNSDELLVTVKTIAGVATFAVSTSKEQAQNARLLNKLADRFAALSSSPAHGGLLVGIKDSSDRDLALLENDGTLPETQLGDAANSTFPETAPRMSPDNRHFVFLSTRSGTRELFLCELNCTTPRQVSDFRIRGETAGAAFWSPDGRKLLATAAKGGRSRIYIIDLDTSDAFALTDGSATDRFPSISEDGRQLYFTSDRSGEWRPWMLDIPSMKLTQISHLPADRVFRLTDGSTLLLNCVAGTVTRLRNNVEPVTVAQNIAYFTCGIAEHRFGKLYYIENDLETSSALKLVAWSPEAGRRIVRELNDWNQVAFGYSIVDVSGRLLVSVPNMMETDVYLAGTKPTSFGN